MYADIAVTRERIKMELIKIRRQVLIFKFGAIIKSFFRQNFVKY